MRFVRVVNQTRGVALAERAIDAGTFWLRLRGLLGRPPLRAGDGLVITPCRGVHMYGMKYSIDVVFADREGEVVGLDAELGPGARSGWYRSARRAIELPAGAIEDSGTRLGDRVTIDFVATSKLASFSAGDVHARSTQPGAA